MAQAPEDSQSVDFSGSWVLLSAENFEEFLESNGVGYIKRKMASSMVSMSTATGIVVQDIKQTNEMLETKESNPMAVKEQIIRFDGTSFEWVNHNGETMKGSMKWNDNKTQIIGDFENTVKKTKGTMKRYINDDGNMVIELTNDKGITMKRIYQKKQQ